MFIPWITIRVHDLAASKRFYGEFLGLPLQREFSPSPEMTIAFFGAKNETQIELIRGERPTSADPAHSSVSVGIAAANYGALLAAARERSLVTAGPMLLGGRTECFFVSDPDGVGIQIIRAD